MVRSVRFLSAVALGLFLATSATAAPPAMTVQIKSFKFAPAVLTVPAGTTVTWINMDEDPHAVVGTDKSFRSAALDTRGKFAFTFAKPGDYAYFCSLHPFMKGRIVVKAR